VPEFTNGISNVVSTAWKYVPPKQKLGLMAAGSLGGCAAWMDMYTPEYGPCGCPPVVDENGAPVAPEIEDAICNEIYAAEEQLPSLACETDTIAIVPDSSYTGSAESFGYYNAITQTITFRNSFGTSIFFNPFTGGYQLNEIDAIRLIHELHHSYQFLEFDGTSDWEEFNNEIASNSTYGEGETEYFVSEYASTSNREDYADTMALRYASPFPFLTSDSPGLGARLEFSDEHWSQELLNKEPAFNISITKLDHYSSLAVYDGKLAEVILNGGSNFELIVHEGTGTTNQASSNSQQIYDLDMTSYAEVDSFIFIDESIYFMATYELFSDHFLVKRDLVTGEQQEAKVEYSEDFDFLIDAYLPAIKFFDGLLMILPRGFRREDNSAQFTVPVYGRDLFYTEDRSFPGLDINISNNEFNKLEYSFGSEGSNFLDVTLNYDNHYVFNLQTQSLANYYPTDRLEQSYFKSGEVWPTLSSVPLTSDSGTHYLAAIYNASKKAVVPYVISAGPDFSGSALDLTVGSNPSDVSFPGSQSSSTTFHISSQVAIGDSTYYLIDPNTSEKSKLLVAVEPREE